MDARYLGGGVIAGLAGEQGQSGRELPQSERAVDQIAQHGPEAAGVPDPDGDTGLVEGGGVGQTVAGYAAVAGDRQAGGERLQGAESSGVLDQDVGGVHEGGHVIDPAIGVFDAVGAQLLGQRLVAAADDDRNGGTAIAQLQGDLSDRSDAPRSRDQQCQRGLLREPEASPGRAALPRTARTEPRIHDRAAHPDIPRPGGPGLRGRHRVRGEVDVDAVGHPQRVNGEVGEVGEDGYGQPSAEPQAAQDTAGSRIGGDDRPGAGVQLA